MLHHKKVNKRLEAMYPVWGLFSGLILIVVEKWLAN